LNTEFLAIKIIKPTFLPESIFFLLAGLLTFLLKFHLPDVSDSPVVFEIPEQNILVLEITAAGTVPE